MSLLRNEDCAFGRESAIGVKMQLLLLDEAVTRLMLLSGRKVAKAWW